MIDYIVQNCACNTKKQKSIARFPYAHELYRTDRPMKDEVRKVPVRGFVLYYAVFEDYVEIRRFLHGRRDRRSERIERT